jgi:hypothetical protein
MQVQVQLRVVQEILVLLVPLVLRVRQVMQVLVQLQVVQEIQVLLVQMEMQEVQVTQVQHHHSMDLLHGQEILLH